MKLETIVDGNVLQANCSEIYKLSAEQLLVDMASMNILFKPYTRIIYGWIVLELIPVDSVLVIAAPDMANKNISVFQDNLDFVLQVLVEQAVLLKSLSCDGEPAFYNHKVVVHQEVFKTFNWYLERQLSTGENDSGWYMGTQDDDPDPPKKDQLTSYYIYELLLIIPEVTPILALPRGYMITMENRRLTKIFDQDDNLCWESK